jgi:hypothetical protein
MDRHLFKNHRNPINIVMHIISVPLFIAAIPMFSKDWRWAVGMMVAGILIQEVGHTFEN